MQQQSNMMYKVDCRIISIDYRAADGGHPTVIRVKISRI